MEPLQRAREIIEIEIQGLQKVRDELGAGFLAALDLMARALADGRKIVVTGVGKNLHIAEKISATLASTGSTSVVLNPSQAMHGDLGILQRDDIVLALSYSGASEELLALVPAFKRLGARLVALTGAADGELARVSDAVILAAVEREACPFNMAPTASTTAALAVGDALAMVLLERRGFRVEDYAKLHPGGAIGRSLLLRVADIMRREQRLAAVPWEADVQAAVVAMTRAKAGATAIVDTAGKVAGIFTDGDLRRHIADGADLLRRPVREVMTPSPIVVRDDELAVTALSLFERHNIDDLLVVDAAGRLVGAIDIQDLPKLKIM